MKNRAFSLIELSIVILIIGILIAGVTQGSRLVRQSKIKTAQNQTQTSPISSIPDLALWLETTMDNSITSATNGNNPENGDLISSWNDLNSQTLAKAIVSQASSASRPTYTSDAINGLPAVKFDGSNDYMLGSNGVSTKDLTVFIVLRVVNSGDMQSFLTTQGAWQSGCLHLLVDAVSFTYPQYSPYPGPANDFVNSNKGVADNKPHIITYRENSSVEDMFVDGANRATYTPSGATKNIVNFAIGAWYQTSGNISRYVNGYLAEIVVFNRGLKTSEITSVNDYLMKKFNIK
jgi:prepilin-type N-terminal cleavage/methylation domain-containing protein